MRIASVLGGFTLGQADLLRRAMGKKKQKEMDAMRGVFVAGAKGRGIPQKEAEKIFELMATFAGYGFNKSHSAAYALVAYQTAFLKTHHPVQFMAALLTVEKEVTDNVVKYIAECREMGLAVLPPDINASELDFAVQGEAIRFGLGAIKNVGDGAIETILAARRSVGPFASLQQICRDVDSRALNRKALESLVKSGALDSLGKTRAVLYLTLDAAVSEAQKNSRDLAAGQASLFGAADPSAVAPRQEAGEEWDARQRLAFEKETLGFYISGHPLREHQETLARLGGPTTRSLTPEMSGKTQLLAGLITALKKRKTRRGDWMATFSLEDLEGAIEVIVFPELYKACQGRLSDEAPVAVRGKVELEDGRYRLVAEDLAPLAGAAERKASQIILEVQAEGFSGDRAREMHRLLREHPGECPVLIRLMHPGYRVTLKPQAPLRVGASPALTQALERVLGKGRVIYR